MTALGKTLVFFVLLFSLVTGGMIVVVFLTQTNWKIAFNAAEKETAVARAALTAEQERIKQDREKYDKKIEELEKRVVALDKDLLGKGVEIKELERQRAEMNQKAIVERTGNEASTLEIEKLKNERDQMVAVITARNTHINKLEKDILDFRNRAVQAEINANAQTGRNERLTLLVEDYKRQLDDFKARGIQLGSGNAPRPPAVEVQGKVLEVAGSFATVSLGRNHEIKEGDTLQVYRLAPAPQYLGTLKITKADVNQSVGAFTPAGRNATIMKGDTVDTKVLGR